MIVQITQQDNSVLIIDTAGSYREVLEERMSKLTQAVEMISLEELTLDLQDTLGSEVTLKAVNDCLHGNKGLINSTRLSLEGNNPFRPSNYITLHPKAGHFPFLKDDDGNEWVRGVVLSGEIPARPNLYSQIRNQLIKTFKLPVYTRYQIQTTDSVNLSK